MSADEFCQEAFDDGDVCWVGVGFEGAVLIEEE